MKRHRDSFTAEAVFGNKPTQKLIVTKSMSRKDMLMLIPQSEQSDLLGIMDANSKKWID